MDIHQEKCSDFDLPRFSSVRYGKHSIRYLGPYLWSRLSAVDRKRLTIENFRNSIRDKDLTTLIDDPCSYHFFYFYLFNCSLVKYNNEFVSLETVFINDLSLFLFIPPKFNIMKYCNF